MRTLRDLRIPYDIAVAGIFCLCCLFMMAVIICIDPSVLEAALKVYR